MSDNKKISIQDRGWDHMRTMLDKELPEKKRKRRLMPFFIFGAFVIALLVFLRLSVPTDNASELNPGNLSEKENQYASDQLSEELNEQDKNRNDQIEVTDNQVVSNLNQSTVQNLSSYPKEKNVDGGIQASTSIIEMTKDVESQSIEDSKTSVILDGASFVQNKEQNALQIANSTSNNKIKGSQVQPLNFNFLEPNLDDLNDKMKAQEVRKVQDPLLQMPKSFLFLKVTEEEIEIKENVSVESATGKSRFFPYLFAMANYQTSVKSLGYGLGVGLDYQMHDWTPYLEAGYSRANFNTGKVDANFSDFGIVVDIEGDNSSSGGQSGVVNNQQFNIENFSNITSSISEIKLNFGIRKKISNHFSFDLGVTYSRLIYASNKTLVINYEKGTSMNESYSINVGSSELYDTGAYSSYDITPHLGLEYNFIPNLFFSLNYNYGLKNLFAQTNVERFNSLAQDESIFKRNIEGKLRYQF